MERKLRIYYDAEFTGLHKNTTPISIGIISESGAYFYAEFTDYDQSQVTDWINENVIQKLVLADEKEGYISGSSFNDTSMHKIPRPANLTVKGNKELIKGELMGWLANESACAEGIQLQFFSDCYAYDWLIMNDLIGINGSALEIPEYVNYIPIDLSTALYMQGIDPDISREEFAGDSEINRIKNLLPFNTWSVDDIKHNCLWDAYICQSCFDKLKNTETNNSNDNINILDQEI